jgi:cytochrome c
MLNNPPPKAHGITTRAPRSRVALAESIGDTPRHPMSLSMQSRRIAVLRSLVVALAAACVFSIPSAVRAADAAHGKQVFRQCSVCHSDKQGENRVGPSLAGVYGTKAGDVPGFNFSKAMKDSGLVWNDETLNKYLENPQKVVKGTRMAFPGVKNEKDREDVIAYLKSIK